MRLSLLFDDPETKRVLDCAQEDALERLDRLTTRQRQIAVMLAEGLPNKTVAHRVGIAPRTIENHRAEIMRRTEVKTYAGLVRLVVLAG